MRIGLVVVGRDAADLASFCLDHVRGVVEELVLVDNSIAPQGYGMIGNHYLSALEVEVMGLCHADTGFGPGAVRALAEPAAQGKLTGIAGKAPGMGIRWCSGEGVGPGPVSTLDSNSLFGRTDLGVRFDTEMFDGLHCCVEDFCLQARVHGIPSEVPRATAGHRGQSTLRPEWQAEYWRYRALLERKWTGLEFETT